MGLNSIALASEDIGSLDRRNGTAIIVSLWECCEAAKNSGVQSLFETTIRRFRKRVLLNYDSVHSHYFVRHFSGRLGVITDIVDVCMARQTELDALFGVPYRWIPESFCRSEIFNLPEVRGHRPLPWAMLGHSNPSRAALAAVCTKVLGSGGLLFLPPIRPYNQASGIDRVGLQKALGASELYVWGSHHSAPYHEGLRALHAVAAGAAPAKIDPLHFTRYSDLPWVYESVQALVLARDRRGSAALYDDAKSYLKSLGPMGNNLCNVLGLALSC